MSVHSEDLKPPNISDVFTCAMDAMNVVNNIEITSDLKRLHCGDLAAPEAKKPLVESTAPIHKTPYDTNKSNRYSVQDQGPYIIIVEGSQQSNIGLLHKMSLGKIIFNTFQIKNEDIGKYP